MCAYEPFKGNLKSGTDFVHSAYTAFLQYALKDRKYFQGVFITTIS